jgi:hypothetical protein
LEENKMAWTAEVVGKNYDNGMLGITVTYTESEGIRLPVTEYYQTSKVTDDWLPSIIRDRIETLKTIPDVPIGTIEPALPVPPMDVNFNLFNHRLEAIQYIKTLIDLKVITEDNKIVIDLKAWLTANFDAEIIKMIGTL